MGGKGSGGARVGAGRKRKKVVDRVAAGTATRAERREAATEAEDQASQPKVEVRPPGRMPREQLAVWKRLAPFAIAAKTLTPSTTAAFRDLCEAVVVKAKMLAQIEKDGWTFMTMHGQKAHPLVTPHRGMMQRVEAGFARFKLAPIGKEMDDAWKAKAAKPTSRLVAFIGGKA